MACHAKLTLNKLLAASGIAFALGFGAPALAGSAAQGAPTPPPQKGVNIGSGPKAPAADDPIARLQMTADLLAVGRAIKDPLALVVAARIMKTLGGTEIDLTSPWPRRSMAELVQEATGIDFLALDVEAARAAANKLGGELSS